MATLVDGWYDVTDTAYGADPTGTTNSTPAILKAMAAMPITKPGTLYFPPGNYLCEDDIHLTRMCVMQGAGAANGDAPATTITFAAGKGVIVEAQTTSPIPNGFGGHSIIRQIEFIGATLPLKDRENIKHYSLGDKIRTPAHNDNRYYFECIKEGTSSNTAPDFTFAYLPYTGAPRPANGSTVVVGQLVHDMAAAIDVYFECTTGGALGGSTPIWKTTPDDTTGDGTAVWTARKAVGYWLTDGCMVWACKLGAGIWMRQRAKVEDCRFYRFTNAGIHVQASGGYAQPTNANGFNIDTCRIVQCGAGVAIRGSDSNAGTMIRLDVEGSGYLWRVDPDDLGSGWIPGGVGIWDGSFLGCQQFGNQVAACTGLGYIVGYYDNDSISVQPAYATLVGCYMEADSPAPRGTSNTIVIGGDFGQPWNDQVVTALGTWGWNNIFSRNLYSPKEANAYLATQGYDTTFASANVDNPTPPFFMGTTYEAPALGRKGWWSLTHGSSSFAGRSFSGLTATEGRGWDWQPWGEFRGGSFSSFTGQYFVAFDDATLNTPRLRGGESLHGHWHVGDRAELQSNGVAGGWTGYIVKKAGYRAPPWRANTQCDDTSYCEPSINGTPIPSPGGKVFKVTAFVGDQTTGTSEPDWSAATVPGDTAIDHNVTWTLIGFVPEYNRIGRIDGDGQTTISMADADITLTAAQAASETTKFTGICNADRNVIYPAPTSDAGAYQRTIRNLTTGGHAVVVGVGVGTTVTVAANKTAIVGFDTAGAYRVTADT